MKMNRKVGVKYDAQGRNQTFYFGVAQARGEREEREPYITVLLGRSHQRGSWVGAPGSPAGAPGQGIWGLRQGV